MANAWSEGSWDESGFGGIETATVTLTGLEASMTLESVVTQTANNFGVTGVSASGAIGEEFALGNQVWGGGVWGGNIGWGGILNADVEVTGVESSGVLGTVTEVIGGTNVVLTGVAGDAALGEEDVSGKATVSPTGVTVTGYVGTVAIAGKAVVNVTGVSVSGSVGSVTTRTQNAVRVTGVRGNTVLGEEEINGFATVRPTGVSATGYISNSLVWGLIDTSQTPNWLPIAA